MAHVGPNHIVGCNEGRINTRFPRIFKRRNKDSGTPGTHLVLVKGELRVKLVLNFDGELCFNLRKHIPVTVVVVANIFLIQERRAAIFVVRTTPLIEPLIDSLLPIRVVNWNVDQDNIIQNT